MGHQRLLRLGEVKQQTGLSRSTIYRLTSSGTFPQRVPLGPRAVAWVESEIDSWIVSKIETSRRTA
jgi:prophage regulatory protein